MNYDDLFRETACVRIKKGTGRTLKAGGAGSMTMRSTLFPVILKMATWSLWKILTAILWDMALSIQAPS